MKPKVLFVASTGSHIRNFHLPYLHAFQARGWSVHVACGAPAGTIPCADRTVELPFEKKMSAPSNLRAAARLRRLIRSEGYALVTVHTSLAAFFCRLALRGMKTPPPLINMVHGYLYDDDTPALKRTVLRTAERFAAPVTDLVLTMNAWDHREAERLQLGRRVAVIPGVGVDFSRLTPPARSDVSRLRREHAIPSDAFVLICAAEFSTRKNQAFLLRALTKLPPHFYLVLAGQGALLEECKALAAALGLSDRVRFPGHVSVAAWYPACSALVSASRSEGLPFNVMEAMHLGLPVVASAVKGHTDLITDGTNGLLYPYGSEQAFADCVLRLASDPALRIDLTVRAKLDVPRYGLDAVLPRVMAEYESLLPAPALTR